MLIARISAVCTTRAAAGLDHQLTPRCALPPVSWVDVDHPGPGLASIRSRRAEPDGCRHGSLSDLPPRLQLEAEPVEPRKQPSQAQGALDGLGAHRSGSSCRNASRLAVDSPAGAAPGHSADAGGEAKLDQRVEALSAWRDHPSTRSTRPAELLQRDLAGRYSREPVTATRPRSAWVCSSSTVNRRLVLLGPAATKGGCEPFRPTPAPLVDHLRVPGSRTVTGLARSLPSVQLARAARSRRRLSPALVAHVPPR